MFLDRYMYIIVFWLILPRGGGGGGSRGKAGGKGKSESDTHDNPGFMLEKAAIVNFFFLEEAQANSKNQHSKHVKSCLI